MKKGIVLTLALLTFFCSCSPSISPTDTTEDTQMNKITENTIETQSPQETQEPEIPSWYTPSKSGLDRLIGLSAPKNISIPVLEDAYISAGKLSDTNFGSEKEIISKAYSKTPNEYYRVPILKFDLSGIEDSNFISAKLSINCTDMEKSDISVTFDLIACNNDWNENTITYNTRPKSITLVNTYTVSSKGLNFIDVTDYIKKCVSEGTKEVSFYIEGLSSDPRRLNFASKESGSISATIEIDCGGSSVTTMLHYDGINPWDQAAERVSAWLNKWDTIKTKNNGDAELVERVDAEYKLIVDGAYHHDTDGNNTAYIKYPTRTVSTLNGYKSSVNETELYDSYGGFTGGEKYEDTGFFYTKKINDRWWVIDPLGYPYYRTAVVYICQGASDNQKAITLAKYGSAKAWAQGATDRLFELGFNSAGGWSDIGNLITADNPLSQTKVLYVLTNYAADNGTQTVNDGVTGFTGDVLPVFDPAFESYALNTVEKQVAPYAKSSYIYGWMSDNELSDTLSMLDNALNLDPTDPKLAYSYAAAWTFMYMKTGNLQVAVSDITNELRLEYRAMVFDRYFEVVADALERYAPNHMYVGCRFSANAYRDEYVIRIAGEYCDVISLNYYMVWEPDTTLIANLQKWSGKPFIVTEWYAKGMDVWEADNRMTNKSGAGFSVRTQSDRGKFYQNYALKLLECKGCVGYDWFQYWDNDPDNLKTDISNRNSNKGILASNGSEYTELTNAMAELNTQKYALIEFFGER